MTDSMTYQQSHRLQTPNVAKATTAAAVVALAAAIAGSGLAAGIATGASIETPAEPAVSVTAPAPETTPPITPGDQGNGGLAIPLKSS